MKTLIEFRNEFFKEMGKSRIKRILIIAFAIAVIWCGVDFFVHDSITMNLWHDLAVLVMAAIVERIIPWGKEKKENQNEYQKEEENKSKQLNFLKMLDHLSFTLYALIPVSFIVFIFMGKFNYFVIYFGIFGLVYVMNGMAQNHALKENKNVY